MLGQITNTCNEVCIVPYFNLLLGKSVKGYLIYEKTSFTSICINYIFKKGLSYLIIISFLVFFINTTHSVTAGEEEFDSDLSCETHSSDRYKPGFFTMNIFLIIS